MNRFSFFLFCFILLSGIPTSAASPSPLYKGKKIVTVGLFPDDSPPLYWHNNQQGIIQLILAEVSQNSRFVFVIKHYPFKRLIHQVADGKLDMEPWTSPVWRQPIKDKVYFTKPFTEHCETMVFRKNTAYLINQPQQLIGKRVGTVQDFTFPSYDELFRKRLINRVSGTDEEGVLKMLYLGRSDVAFINKTAAEFLIKEKYANSLETKNTFDCVPITFMFNKKKSDMGREISEVLEKLKGRNVINKITQSFNQKTTPKK